jgi:hypothetical protein
MAAGKLGVPSPHCRAELAVKLAKFSTLATGKMGMPSPHCRAGATVLFLSGTTLSHWLDGRAAHRKFERCGEIAVNGSIVSGLPRTTVTRWKRSSTPSQRFAPDFPPAPRAVWSLPLPIEQRHEFPAVRAHQLAVAIPQILVQVLPFLRILDSERAGISEPRVQSGFEGLQHSRI